MRDLQDVVRVKKPTVVREDETVKRCFMYEGVKECFEDRCFWYRNGECPIAKSLKEERDCREVW